MDLQAILAASDSSDEADAAAVTRTTTTRTPMVMMMMKPSLPLQLQLAAPPRYHDEDDLERILLDDDDDDDEEEEDDDDDYEQGQQTRQHPARSSSSRYSRSWNATASHAVASPYQQQPQQHTDNWAVLQAILNERDHDDDDHDDEDDYHYHYGDHYGHADITDASEHSSTQQAMMMDHKMTVDAILMSSDNESENDDDDDDNHHHNNNDYSFNHNMTYSPASMLLHKTYASPARSTNSTRVDDDTGWLSPSSEALHRSMESQQLQEEVDNNNNNNNNTATMLVSSTSPRGKQVATRNNDSMLREEKKQAEANNKTSARTTTSVDALEETSRRALALAHSYERKLLKSGHREIVSPLMVKRRLRPKVELHARGGKTGASSNSKSKPSSATTTTTSGGAGNGLERLTSSSWNSASRYNFSGVTENKRMETVSDNMASHGEETYKVYCGLPTALAVNSKFIAVGTQKGIILLYDLFEQLRQRLGHGYLDETFNAKKAGAITSLDLNYNGELICAGYASGNLVLWDSIRGIPLKNVSDAHPSPITSIRFMGEVKLVTVDAGGIVNKLTFTKNMIWSNYSLETECLLDGTAGQILAMSVLAPFATVNPNVRPDAFAPVLRKLTLIALSSERSSFAVAVEPIVNVLHRWARPAQDRIDVIDQSLGLPVGQVYLPCLAWGWALVSGGQNVVMPILARAWGCCLQLLQTSFPTLDAAEAISPGNSDQMVHWPAFGVHEEIDTGSPVLALQWLDDRSLVYLTATHEFTLVDTVMLTLLERIDFSPLTMVYAEFALSRNVSADNDDEKVTLLSCTTFQNSIRSSDGRLMVLCCDELRCVSIVGAKRRVASLEEDGEWLEALALALDHYESTILSQEDRKREPLGKKDLSHLFSGVRNEEEEWIAKLLVRYVNLAVDNAPIISHEAPMPNSVSPSGRHVSRNYLAESHFQMLAGVVLEYCVTTRRLDLLFGPIFQRFQSAGFTSVFLDVLEPYVLNDKLSYIAPETMAYFVQHCKATNGVATVERCLLHLDCTMMDFDNLLHLLRANEMYSALFYVYNQGLNDYITPLEVLLERVFDEVDAGCLVRRLQVDGPLQTTFGKLGYKALLYIQTCFKGLAFPVDKQLVDEDRQQSIKRELLSFFMREKFVHSPHFKRGADASAVVGLRGEAYPYARVLLLVDPKAMFDTLSLGLSLTGNSLTTAQSDGESLRDWTAINDTSVAKPPDKQLIVNMLSSIVLPAAEGEVSSMSIQAPTLIAAFLDFAAQYLMDNAVRVDKEIVMKIIARLVDRFLASEDREGRQQTQKQMLDLFSALPRNSYDPDEALSLIDKAGIHRAALLLHQQVASSWHEDNSKDIELRSIHFKSAIDCYIGDHEESFRREVFDYVKKECAGLMKRDDGYHQVTLRDALSDKLPALVKLDPLQSAQLVAELFVDELDHVVQILQPESGGKSLFKFLRVIVSGDLIQFDPVAGSVLNLTNQHHEIYLALMAKLHPELVYEYLSSHDNYRPEDCLKLCQKYDIADASAYLLERLGNISSALQLILQTLESRMMNLKRSIRGMGVEVFRKLAPRRNLNGRRSNAVTELPGTLAKDVENVKRILVVALDLCERNSQANSVRTEHGSQLWFNVLDRLMNAKGFLRLEKEQPEHATVMGRVLSALLHLTMQRMVSSVPLNDLVRKITADSSGSRLGDMREMIESFIGTYGFELRVFEGAIAAFHQDVRLMQEKSQKLALEGAVVRTVGSVPVESDGAAQFLRKVARSDVALSTVDGNAILVEMEGLSYSQRVETGLVSTLGRLREKRGRKVGQDANRLTKSGLNMMTVSEQLYQRGECEPVLYGARVSGALGDAEHRGRLVTFG